MVIDFLKWEYLKYLNNKMALRITGLYAQTACSAVWVPFG